MFAMLAANVRIIHGEKSFNKYKYWVASGRVIFMLSLTKIRQLNQTKSWRDKWKIDADFLIPKLLNFKIDLWLYKHSVYIDFCVDRIRHIMNYRDLTNLQWDRAASGYIHL